MTKTGASEVIAAAVGQAAESLAADRAAEDPEQLALLMPPTRFEGAEAEKMRATLEKAHSGRGGRPAGAENRATKQFRAWLLKVGADPLQQMMRYSLHTPETLAMELGCTKLEAMRELRALWEGLGAYLHPKLAPVGDDGQAVPFFQMVLGASVAIEGGGKLPPWLADPEVAKGLRAAAEQREQNQALSDGETGRHMNGAPTIDV